MLKQNMYYIMLSAEFIQFSFICILVMMISEHLKKILIHEFMDKFTITAIIVICPQGQSPHSEFSMVLKKFLFSSCKYILVLLLILIFLTEELINSIQPFGFHLPFHSYSFLSYISFCSFIIIHILYMTKPSHILFFYRSLPFVCCLHSL